MKAQPHENRDVSFGGFALLAGSYTAIVVLGAIVAFGAQALLMRRWSKSEAGVPAAVDVPPPEPRLETDNSAELDGLRAREDRLLSRYSWVDRRLGIARIPLDRAVDVALDRGFPEGTR